MWLKAEEGALCDYHECSEEAVITLAFSDGKRYINYCLEHFRKVYQDVMLEPVRQGISYTTDERRKFTPEMFERYKKLVLKSMKEIEKEVLGDE